MSDLLSIPRRLLYLVVAGSLLTAGCAPAPTDVAPAPVSAAAYSGLSCRQLRDEAIRLNDQVATLTGQQQRKASNDAVAMGVGMVLFWPALFALGASGDVSPQLAQAKGQAEALQAAARQKGC